MKPPRIAILHYTAPPVVGGVEAVIQAHARLFAEAGYPTTIIAGRGEAEKLPAGVDCLCIPEIDSQHSEIIEISDALEQGDVPQNFEVMVEAITVALKPILDRIDILIVHNVFNKHFNLPLTAALYRLLDQGLPCGCIAWCHDFTWTSPSSRRKVYPGYPWDLLRTQRKDMTYVVVSKGRKSELAGLFGCSPDRIKVIYNGVDPVELLGLSKRSLELIHRLGLLDSELNILMPVRVTKAKNIEFALKVTAALKEYSTNVRLVLTGPPDPHDPNSLGYYQSIRDMRKRLGVEEQMCFVYESGSHPEKPHHVDIYIVGDLFRLSDVMFMPSHREGFGMPVLEAGLAGVPVVARGVPAAGEIAGREVAIFEENESAEEVAALIIRVVEGNTISRLRQMVRLNYTWEAIFRRDIVPLIEGKM